MTTQPQTGAAETAVNRKVRVGVVVSDKMDRTIVVTIERASRHRLYHKVVRRTKRYHVDDPENRATLGDQVRIEECRPISKTKHWRLVEVLTERDVAEVGAEEIDVSLVDEVQRTAARAAAEAATAEDSPTGSDEAPSEQAAEAEQAAEPEAERDDAPAETAAGEDVEGESGDADAAERVEP
jgi:small subunit ribosomal protein S17